MSCNSAIHTVNQTNQEITTTAGTFVQVPFGSVIHRFGRSLNLDGNSINCCGSGYYDVAASVNLTPTAAGPITVQIRENGVVVPGMAITATGTADEPLPLSLKGLIRNFGCEHTSILTLWIDAPCTVTNAAVVIEKL